MLGARSGQGFRSLSSPRGYGDSSTPSGNKIVGRFFEVAVAAGNVGSLPHSRASCEKSLMVFHTRHLHGNSVFVFDKYQILANAPWIQPLAFAGRFRIEDFVSACVERSGTLLLSLCAEPQRARNGPPHRQSRLDCLGTHR